MSKFRGPFCSWWKRWNFLAGTLAKRKASHVSWAFWEKGFKLFDRNTNYIYICIWLLRTICPRRKVKQTQTGDRFMSPFGYLCPGCFFGWPFLQAQVLLSKKIVRTFSSDGESRINFGSATPTAEFFICRRRKELDVKLVFICWLIGLWGRRLLEEKIRFQNKIRRICKNDINFLIMSFIFL